MIPTPTPRELEILKVLWESGPAGVRDVYRKMAAAQEEDLAYNTIQTMLRIMEDKGLVSHESVGRAFIYSPVFTRDESLNGYVDRVFDGAASELVAALIKNEKLNAKELTKIRHLIDQAKASRT